MDGATENAQYLRLIGKHIRGIRMAQSISQEELAARAGVHRTYVGMIERGEKNLTILSARKIATALNLSVPELLNGVAHG